MQRGIPATPGSRPALAGILLVLALFPPAASAFDLRYGLEAGTTIETTVTFEASGEISSPSGALPVSLEGTIYRDYDVVDQKPGRLLVLQPELDSAAFRVLSGSEGYGIRLTPESLEVNGVVAWASETGRAPPLQYLPFLRPQVFQMDRRGRLAAGVDAGHQVEAQPGVYRQGLRHLSSTVSSLFAGEREVFPILPERRVEPGEQWTFSGPVIRISPEGPGVVRSATYTVAGGNPTGDGPVRIEVVEHSRVREESGLEITETLEPDAASGRRPAPKPREAEREVIRFRTLERDLRGTWLFDPARGRPLSYEATGTERLEVTAVRHYRSLQDVIPLTYTLELEMRVQFEYPAGR